MTKEEAKLVLDNARPQTKEIDRQFYDDEDLNNALDLAIKALEQQPCETAIDKKEVFDILKRNYCGQSVSVDGYCVPANYREDIYDEIEALPPVTPTHGICKDCEHCGNKYANHRIYCSWLGGNYEENFYCADFEKRGVENE